MKKIFYMFTLMTFFITGCSSEEKVNKPKLKDSYIFVGSFQNSGDKLFLSQVYSSLHTALKMANIGDEITLVDTSSSNYQVIKCLVSSKGFYKKKGGVSFLTKVQSHLKSHTKDNGENTIDYTKLTDILSTYSTFDRKFLFVFDKDFSSSICFKSDMLNGVNVLYFANKNYSNDGKSKAYYFFKNNKANLIYYSSQNSYLKEFIQSIGQNKKFSSFINEKYLNQKVCSIAKKDKGSIANPIKLKSPLKATNIKEVFLIFDKTYSKIKKYGVVDLDMYIHTTSKGELSPSNLYNISGKFYKQKHGYHHNRYIEKATLNNKDNIRVNKIIIKPYRPYYTDISADIIVVMIDGRKFQQTIRFISNQPIEIKDFAQFIEVKGL
jgi:hypothetical protein